MTEAWACTSIAWRANEVPHDDVAGQVFSGPARAALPAFDEICRTLAKKFPRYAKAPASLARRRPGRRWYEACSAHWSQTAKGAPCSLASPPGKRLVRWDGERHGFPASWSRHHHRGRPRASWVGSCRAADAGGRRRRKSEVQRLPGNQTFVTAASSMERSSKAWLPSESSPYRYRGHLANGSRHTSCCSV